MSIEALQKAVAKAGGQSQLARRIGGKIRQQHVHQWLKAGLPAEQVMSVARAVDFAVTPHDLRPDMYPNERDGIPGAGCAHDLHQAVTV